MENLHKSKTTFVPQSNTGTAIRYDHQLNQDAICDLIIDTVYRYHRRDEDGNIIIPLSVQEDWAELCNSVDCYVAELAALDQDPEARQLVEAQIALKWRAIVTRRGWTIPCASYNANLSSGLDQ